MIDEWNENMDNQFSDLLVSLLYESISKCLCQYTFPGFMYVPRNSWTLGNEYQIIACEESGLPYQVDMLEVKDTSRQSQEILIKGGNGYLVVVSHMPYMVHL